MAAEPQGPDSLQGNGTADAHLPNGGLDNSASALENGSAKLSAAEKKRLKKKQRKANKQAQRWMLSWRASSVSDIINSPRFAVHGGAAWFDPSVTRSRG